MSLDLLISKQNPDGGWPHVRGRSWTEPTVYAVLALLAGDRIDAASRGIGWLLAHQRPDGGWPAQSGVVESCWVTALVALLPPEQLGTGPHSRAIQWLLSTRGMESEPAYRFREWLLGVRLPAEEAHTGWPWVPGAAAWVAPTAIAILALEKQLRCAPSRKILERIGSGRNFLLSRTCADGGWNHGGVHDLGYPARPYPEITGMALLALRGVQSEKVERALAIASALLNGCRSAHALNWLRLGLLAHGRLPPGYCPPDEVAYRTLPDLSLGVLAGAAAIGRNCFWG